MASPELETAAIVLECRDHGESDKIITFFCPEAGRLSGIAKGANRSKRRFVNKLELFSSLQLTYTLPRYGSLAFISAAELKSGFLNLRKNVDLYNAATVIREFVLMGVSEKECDSRVFILLHWALQSLDEKRPHLPIVIMFLLRFFDYIGYRPDLLNCQHCNLPVSSQQGHRFNYMTGGLVCQTCSAHDFQTTVPLSPGTIRLLTDVQGLPLERLHRLQFSSIALDESLVLLHHYGRRLFQRDIHSWKTIVKAGDKSQETGVRRRS
jgi:DNA repair protein RecO (recombination protein O)